MKIGIDGRALTSFKAGIGTYCYQILKKLNELDSENEYYIYSNKEVVLDFKLNKNFTIVNFKSKIGTYGMYFKLPKQLKKDGINVFWGTQHCLPKRNKYTKDIKYILTIHDLAIEKFKNISSLYNTIIQKLIVKKSCNISDKIVADSKATKNDIIDIFKIKEKKIDVIYAGSPEKVKYEIKKEDEKKIKDKYFLNDNSKFLFYLSSIDPRKNLDTIIKAFEEYKINNNDDLKFIISGRVGSRYKNTLKLIENSKFNKDIIMTGYITEEEKQFFFKHCVAFTYPSLYEGFGLPVLEAFQNEAIVITSNVSSLPEVAGDAALYLNNVFDYKELENLIKKAVNLSIEERREYIGKGKKQVEYFSWDKCSKQILDVLQNYND